MSISKLFVIDKDPHYRERVSAIAKTLDLEPDAHQSGESFLTAFSPDMTGCIVCELRLIGISGLELLDHLVSLQSCMPVIFLTGHARTQVTVAAMQRGAMTVLDKPLDEDEVWNAIRRGLLESDKLRTRWQKDRDIQRRFATLTAKESEVAEMIIRGKTNREIAGVQQVSVRTIETRRQKTYSKLGAATLPEFVEMMMRYDESNEPRNPTSVKNRQQKPLLGSLPAVNVQVEPIRTD